MLDLISFYNWTHTLNQILLFYVRYKVQRASTEYSTNILVIYVFFAGKRAILGFVLIDNGAQGLNIVFKNQEIWILIPIRNLDNSVSFQYHIQSGEDV